MYCLAPLSAIDLNQDSNASFENLSDSEKNTSIDISNETSIDTDDSSNDISNETSIDTDDSSNDISDEYKSEMDIEKINNTVNKTLTKRHVSFDVDIKDCNYGEKPVAIINCHKVGNDHAPIYVTGYFELSCPQFTHKYAVNNLDYWTAVKSNYKIPLDENLEPGQYKVDIYYGGDEDFEPWRGSTSFLVKANADPNLDIHIDDALYGEEANVTIKANESVNGHVGVKINDGHTYGFKVVNGLAQGSISRLAPGNYTAKAIYGGDYMFAESEKTTTFTVKENPNPKTRPYLSVHVNNITDFEQGIVEINTNESLNGDVKVNVMSVKESRNVTVKVENGVGHSYINNLSPGNYTVVASFDGNDKFKQVANSTTFNVRERDTPNLSIDAVGNTKADKTEIKIQTNANLSNPVEIKLNNSQKYYLNLENGTGTLTIDDLPGGEYTATVIYNGDIYYKGAENTTQFTKQGEANLNMDIRTSGYSGSTAVVAIKSNKLLNDNVKVQIDNGNYHEEVTVKLVDGEGEATFGPLNPGTYNVKATFDGNKILKPGTTNSTVTVQRHL